MRFPTRRKHASLLVVMCLGLVGALTLAGCGTGSSVQTSSLTISMPTATATRAPTATATPHPVTAFTCASGSLPVSATYTRTSCGVTAESGFQVLRASYTFTTADPLIVDESRLQQGGWLSMWQIHGDSPNGAIGSALYFGMGAWFLDRYSMPAGTLDIEQGIPPNPQASIACGQTLTSGSEQRMGAPLPASSLTLDGGMYTVVSACVEDVVQFYTRTLPAAGWTQVQPFQVPPGGGNSLTNRNLVGTFSHGSQSVDIWLAGALGTGTMILIGQH